MLWDHASTYAYDCSGPLCDYGCSDGGDMGLIINPGATAEIEWGGGVWLPTPISDACREQAGCINDPGATCSVLDIVEGEYLVRVNLSATCPVDDECMACTEGVCEVFFYDPFAADIAESFTATASFPAGARSSSSSRSSRALITGMKRERGSKVAGRAILRAPSEPYIPSRPRRA